jgi:transketolase
VSERKAGRVPPSSIFFLGRENFPKAYVSGAKYALGKAQVLRQASGSRKVLIATTGSMVPEALLAAQELEKKNLSAAVINCNSINQVDVDTIAAVLKSCDGNLITVEDHQVLCGFGQILTHALLQNGVSFKVRSLGVQGEFGRSAYNAKDLYSHYRIDHKAIIQAAL